MIAEPSNPAHFVMTSSSPGCIPPVERRSPRATFPTPVTVMTGRFTASDTSVCPPKISICNSSHACSNSLIIRLRSCSSVSGGKIMLLKIPIGSAPAVARSFAVICTAYTPICLSAPVIGSVESTNTSPCSGATAAQSSPTPGCSKTSCRLW